MGEPNASLRDGRPAQPSTEFGRAATVCVRVAKSGDFALSLLGVLSVLRFHDKLAPSGSYMLMIKDHFKGIELSAVIVRLCTVGALRCLTFDMSGSRRQGA